MNNIEDKIKAELCRRSLYYFIQEFWNELESSTFKNNWHIKYLTDTLQELYYNVKNKVECKDLIINICPATSKSIICSQFFPAWCWIQDPSFRIITGSFSKTIALENSTKSRNVIQSEKYFKYFNIKIKIDENTKNIYKTDNKGVRYTTSTGSNITGVHADLIIIDDAENPSTVNSEEQSKNVRDWVTGVLSTRKTDKEFSRSVFIQQRLSAKDLSSYLITRKEYDRISLPGLINNDIKPIPLELEKYYVNNLLDENRLNLKTLELLKTDLGSRNFNSQILQNPSNTEDSIIKSSWFNYFETIEEEPLMYFIDSAYGTEKSDYSAILECFSKNSNLYITNVFKFNLDYPKLILKLKEILNTSNNKTKIFIENKATGLSIQQTLKSETNWNIVSINSKDSKLNRLNAIAPKVEGSRVFLRKANWNSMFLDEICVNDPANDDQRDTFVFAVETLLINKKNLDFKFDFS